MKKKTKFSCSFLKLSCCGWASFRFLLHEFTLTLILNKKWYHIIYIKKLFRSKQEIYVLITVCLQKLIIGTVCISFTNFKGKKWNVWSIRVPKYKKRLFTEKKVMTCCIY